MDGNDEMDVIIARNSNLLLGRNKLVLISLSAARISILCRNNYSSTEVDKRKKENKVRGGSREQN